MSAPDEQAELELRVAEYIRVASEGDFEESRFDQLATAIHRFQFRANEPYARYCRALEVSESIETWRQVPAVPQQAFKHADLRSFPAAETVATFHTSGTTGEGPGRHHFRTIALYELVLRSGWRLAGLPVGRAQIILIPPPAENPHSSLSQMMGALGEFATEQSWFAHVDQAGMRIDLDALRSRIAQARTPLVMLGTALAYLHLFERLGETRLELPVASVAFETGGYKGSGRELSKSELYTQFHVRLGLPADMIWNEYGMTELSSQCYARGLGTPHRTPPWMRALVIDPESGHEAAPGAIGALRLIDLANVGSVLGVQTQDLARQIDGEQFELLGRDPAALPRGCSRAADEILSIRS